MTVLELRKELKVSQSTFAKIIGIGHNRLHRHENNITLLSNYEIEHIGKESMKYMLKEIGRYNRIIERMEENV